MTTILCPSDFSPQSDAALTYASSLAHQLGAKLLIVHVKAEDAPEPVVVGGGGTAAYVVPEDQRREQRDSTRATASERLLQYAPSDASVPYEHVLCEGDPAEEILNLAKERSASQIVMGTHGRRGFHRVLLGSTAEEVVRRAPCPVTVVKNESIQSGQ